MHNLHALALVCILTDNCEVLGDEGCAEGGCVGGHFAAVVASESEANVLEAHAVSDRRLVLPNLWNTHSEH